MPKIRFGWVLVALAGAVGAQGQYLGPAYPPPGGVNYGQLGFAGTGSGATLTFSNIFRGQFTQLYWGPLSGNSILSSTDGPPTNPLTGADVMSFNPGMSSLGSGIAYWTGATRVNTPSAIFLLETRATLRALDINNNPIPWYPTGPGLPISTPIALNVPAVGAFKVNFLVEARQIGFSVWVPIMDLFNGFQANFGQGTRTSLNGAFWYVPPVTVQGTIDLGDFAASPGGQVVEIQLRDPNTTATLETHFVALSASPAGSYAFTTTLQGSFLVSAKASHWLRRSPVSPITITASGSSVPSITLVNGDCVPDNAVDIGDYSVLSSAFGSFEGDPNFNGSADLNGDAEVSVGDYAILSQNFGLFGDD